MSRGRQHNFKIVKQKTRLQTAVPRWCSRIKSRMSKITASVVALHYLCTHVMTDDST
jgi:hypothetical protein